MYNTPWIDRPAHWQNEPSAEELALKETFLAAQKIAFSLVCASNQMTRLESPEVTACAAVLREAVHKPEKNRATAIKAAEQAIVQRQIDFISTLAYYQPYADAWKNIRPTLVAQLEAVALMAVPEKVAYVGQTPHVDADLALNCEAVAGLIEECDIAVNEASKRPYMWGRPTEHAAEAAFQKLFDALVAEVTGEHWVFNARRACHSSNTHEGILRDLQVEKISSSHVPAEFEKLNALDAAREAFEQAFCYNTTTTCRDFQQNTRGTVNDTHFSEQLLAASPDVAAMQRVEERRDTKLRGFGRSWRSVRRLVDHCQFLFIKVAEALPEALAEAAAIKDEKVRRQAQNLCLFAARRLQENIKYICECDRWIGDHTSNFADVSAAVSRGHLALVERIKSKEIHRPSNRCREEPYMG